MTQTIEVKKVYNQIFLIKNLNTKIKTTVC